MAKVVPISAQAEAENHRQRQGRQREDDKVAVALECLGKLSCFTEVQRRLVQGESIRKLANYIQQDKCELLHLTRLRVEKYLTAYQSSLSPAEKLGAIDSLQVAEAKLVIAKGLEACEYLQELAMTQRNRIKEMREIEKRTKLPLQMLGKEIIVGRDIVLSYVEVAQQLGLLAPKKLGELDVAVSASVGSRYGAQVASVAEDPLRRRRVLGMVQELLSVDNIPAAVSEALGIGEILPARSTVVDVHDNGDDADEDDS